MRGSMAFECNFSCKLIKMKLVSGKFFISRKKKFSVISLHYIMPDNENS